MVKELENRKQQNQKFKKLKLDKENIANDLNLFGGELEDCQISNCELVRPDFRMAKLNNVKFNNCHFIQPMFSLQCELNDVTFNNCTIDGIDYQGIAKIDVKINNSLVKIYSKEGVQEMDLKTLFENLGGKV